MVTVASVNVNVDVDGERVEAGQLNREEEAEANSSSSSSSSSSLLDICLNVKMRIVCNDGVNYEFPEISKKITSISLPRHPKCIQNPTMCRSCIQIGLSNCLSDPDQAHLHRAADSLLTDRICPNQPQILDQQQQQQQPINAVDLVAQRVASTASSALNSDSDHDSDGFGVVFHFVAHVEIATVLTGISPAVGLVFKSEHKKFIARDNLKKKQTFQVSSSSSSSGNQEELVGVNCCICLQDLSASGIDLIRLPNCGHVFHQKCILSWLKNSDLCPLCRDLCLENLDDLMTDLTI